MTNRQDILVGLRLLIGLLSLSLAWSVKVSICVGVLWAVNPAVSWLVVAVEMYQAWVIYTKCYQAIGLLPYLQTALLFQL